MVCKHSLLLLVSLACIALTASEDSETFEELVARSERRIVKRDILDDIRNAFSSIGNSFTNVIEQIKSFTADNYEKFKTSLANLGKDEQQKTFDKLKEYYDTLSDKTSAEAQRIKGTMDELADDIANGSGSLSCSLAVATVATTLTLAILH